MISAEQAGEMISGYIEKSWPHDKEQVFRVLDLVQETIWNAGLFENPTRWFYAKINKDNTIVTPDGYNVLIGARLKFAKMDIRNELFMFHENGPMLEPGEDSNFTKHVQFVGTYPTLINHINDRKVCAQPFKVGVAAECVSYSSQPPILIVSGKRPDGKKIYTYTFEHNSDPEIIEEESVKEYHTEDLKEIIEGVMYNISDKVVVYDNILFSDIYNIRKEPTATRVNVFAIDANDCSKATKIASLDPFETQSSYNIYHIPNNACKESQAFCLFKKSKPSSITNDSQLLLTSSKTALISISKGVYEKFHKNNIQLGDKLIGDGIMELNQLLLASNPNIRKNLEVRDTRMVSVKKSFRNFR